MYLYSFCSIVGCTPSCEYGAVRRRFGLNAAYFLKLYMYGTEGNGSSFTAQILCKRRAIPKKIDSLEDLAHVLSSRPYWKCRNTAL